MTQEESLHDPNSIMIRLNQIQNNGIVTITHDNISVNIQISNETSPIAKENTQHNNLISYDELENLYNDNINKLYDKDSKKLYDNFKTCFNKIIELQECIQNLHTFGKSFVYEASFFDIEKITNTKGQISLLIIRYKKYFNVDKSQAKINYPPFLTIDNLLYFGSLLQNRQIDKIKMIIDKMFDLDLDKVFTEAIGEVYSSSSNQSYINDPIKSSIQLFSTIYKNIKPWYFSDLTNMPPLATFFYDLQKELQLYFTSQNLLTIKVNIPSETFHVLHFISCLLYSNFKRKRNFYENFFCYEDSDINLYFTDILRLEKRPKYIFIIHPEFLSIKNQNVLNEKISSRLLPVPDMNLQKIVIITSSSKFISGNQPENLNGKFFTRGEASIKVDASLMRNYCSQVQQFYFGFQIVQLPKELKTGSGKTTFINQKIKQIKHKFKKYKFKSFRYFIADGNQHIPIDAFNNSNKKVKNIIHFQFDDEIMEKGIKFFSQMYQLYTSGFCLPKNREPLIIDFDQNVIFFEIPQIRKSDQPIQDLNEFPLPLSSKYPHDSEIIPGPFTLDDTILKLTDFQEGQCNPDYYKFGINKLLNELNIQPKKQINNVKDYIEFMYSVIFDTKDSINLSYRKIGYIEKYLHKFTKLYINSLDCNKIDMNQFVPFFYWLTVSLFYSYNCLPKEKEFKDDKNQIWIKGNGLTFFTVDNLFCNSINPSQKKFHFYTTKSPNSFFKPFKNPKSYIKSRNFISYFNYNGKNPNPHIELQSVFCSSDEYITIVENYKKKYPQSYIAHTKMTAPTLYRSSIILSRIFLSQPIIFSGDAGCGKTSTLMMLFEYFNLPINKSMDKLKITVCKILNCHGGITKEDVKKHLKKAPQSSKKHVCFFDELNTSPASSFIEQLILNENIINHCKFTFIGALNPWKPKNKISSIMTEIGLPQLITEEEKPCNLIKKESMEKEKVATENISDMMYHVRCPQEAIQDIIFDFNPICYEEKYQKVDMFYPNEERESVH